MTNRRQRRKAEKERRHREARQEERREPRVVLYARPADRVERLTYTRRQAAEALGVSLSTIDRRVVPAIDTFFNEWGMRLIPIPELRRYVAERTKAARAERRPRRRPGRPPSVPSDVIVRIRDERARGMSLGQIARSLNADSVSTAQGGRQWWPSTVRAVLVRNEASGERVGEAVSAA